MALGIASVLGVSVVQKSREIGILKATGTSTSSIQQIFLIQGAAVGLVGSIGGSAFGVLMAAAFAHFARRPTGEPLFPIQLDPGLFVTATIVAIGTGLAAAVPAGASSRSARSRRGHPQWLIRSFVCWVSRRTTGEKVRTRVLHGIDLEVRQGEFAAMMGPSGSGKSTLLNLIGLLDRPTEGQIEIAGQRHRAARTTPS